MSRQRDYQKRRIAEGNCARCGKKRERYKTLCDLCRARANEEDRRRKARAS